jgi:hypothetical protein
MSNLIVNLGGEGEVPGVVNVQGDWAQDPSWRSSAGGETLAQLRAAGHQFIFVADFSKLPFADNSVRQVITNNVPVDQTTFLGPGIQSSEIERILERGGTWLDNGSTRMTK